MNVAYTVVIENRAQKDFLKLSPDQGDTVRKNIDGLHNDPRTYNVKKLAGTKNGYRFRVGDYRVLFTIDDRHKLVTIYRIRHRREAYD